LSSHCWQCRQTATKPGAQPTEGTRREGDCVMLTNRTIHNLRKPQEWHSCEWLHINNIAQSPSDPVPSHCVSNPFLSQQCSKPQYKLFVYNCSQSLSLAAILMFHWIFCKTNNLLYYNTINYYILCCWLTP
jgi:hypothetical protein